MKLSAQSLAVLLFMALCIISALYAGALRELEESEIRAQTVYDALTPEQRMALQNGWTADHAVSRPGEPAYWWDR